MNIKLALFFGIENNQKQKKDWLSSKNLFFEYIFQKGGFSYGKSIKPRRKDKKSRRVIL